MKQYFIALLMSFLTWNSVQGQIKTAVCDCPKTQHAGIIADTVFHLSNGKTIVLCGYKIPGSSPTTYSEFVLAVCGQDHIIDFWSAVFTHRLSVKRDTLFVDQLHNLPIGEKFKYQESVWITEKIYFTGQKVVRGLVVNRQIRKYTKSEIQTVLKTYEMAEFGLDDRKIEIANKLFVAAISGDKKARQHFKDFETKFGTLDGAFAEEYNELTSLLNQWDKSE